MTTTFVTILLWAAAFSSGLITGVYFAFSGFIMKAFGKIETTHSVAAMKSINEVIVRSMFMPVFFGSSIISFLLIVVAIVYWGDAGAVLTLIAGMVYLVGMFACTIVFNVPRNNTLAKLDPDSDNAQQIWSSYLKTWTRWNHLRTACSLITCVLCIWLLTGN
jgi:uncharacterized membrane protein